MYGKGVLNYADGPLECGTDWAIPFFMSFVCCSLIVINLFVAITFECLEEARSREFEPIIQTCCEMWVKYDPGCALSIPLF